MPTGSPLKKYLTPSEARTRIQRYCAYQERSHFQVRKKLYDYGLRSAEVETIIAELITDNFLSEERFAKAFAGGKFRMKNWGRKKIEYQLKSQGLSKQCISTGLKEINPDDYLKTMVSLLKKKLATLKHLEPLLRKHKLARFLIGKGYESEMVWQQLEKIFPD